MTLRTGVGDGALSSEIDLSSADVNRTPTSPGGCLEYLRRRLTICVTTKDRQDDIDELFRALSFLGLQTLPIRIIDDGSAVPIRIDVSSAFADVVLVRHDVSSGYIERRNNLIANSPTPFVLSLDDDSSPLALTDLSDVLSEMEEHPDWAVVGYTIVGSQRGDLPREPKPTTPPRFVPARDFVGCGFIVRCDVFRRIGGFTTALWYLGEERDFCMRTIAGGYEIARVENRYIVHFRSPVNRSSTRFVEYTARNLPVIWLLNCPECFRWVMYARSVVGILGLGLLRRWEIKSLLRGLSRGKQLYGDAACGKRQRLSHREFWRWWRRN